MTENENVMTNVSDKDEQSSALHDLAAQVNRFQIEIASINEKIMAIGEAFKPLEETSIKLLADNENQKVKVTSLEKQVDDIVKQFAATRVPVPEKELAQIKKFLTEKYHYKPDEMS